MFGIPLVDKVVKVFKEKGPVTIRQLLEQLSLDPKDPKDREKINSLLYGELRSLVIRDKDENGCQTWRLKGNSFEAAKGLEVKFYTELLKRKIITQENSQLDLAIEHPRKRKVYHLDIAVVTPEQKYNIEIDGYEHMRADAMDSMQRQIEKKGEKCEIDIDWMDHERSYVDFKRIDNKIVYKWCANNISWCIRYHEELLWPHDITRNIWLIENGWCVMRFWNFEIRDDLERCIRDVRELIGK